MAIIYTTVSSKEEAVKLTEQAVINKLAACANIITDAISVYEWEGKLEKSKELLIIFKTSIEKQDDLYNWLLKNHPYDVPAIIKFTADTSPEFYQFIKNN